MKYKNTSNSMIRIFVNGKVRELGANAEVELGEGEVSGPACLVAVGKPKAKKKKPTTTVRETTVATTTTPTTPKRTTKRSTTAPKTSSEE
jgi:hypothetical protein